MNFRSKLAFLALLISAPFSAHAQSASPIDLTKAQAAFAEARDISDKEAGRLWGRPLYGAMLLVDPATRAVVANEPDPDGVLHQDGNVYVGTLPASVIVSNAPTVWEAKRWTMLMWPLYGDALTQRVTFAHELFHRIQPALHLDAPDSLNLQLDTREGRIWLQLEWRALAAALMAKGSAQTSAIRDAIAFRDHRHAIFPGSDATERNLEIAEGVPEYTGVVAGTPDTDAARWRTITKLADPDPAMTFVRSFAYTSGPAYGLLLDQRLPGWRTKLSKESDLAELLATTLRDAAPVSAEQQAAHYGKAAIEIVEIDRAAKADSEKARYRALLVDGPTLTLPRSGNLKFSFNPSTLISLGDAGTVYPTFHASDAWGILDVKDGALVPTDFSRAVVAAPKDMAATHLEGPGWTLDLAPGWHVVPGPSPRRFTVEKS
ncbi:MAG: hypothetical protein ABSD74_14785 [Rhizomicrobium sp.]